VSIHGERAEQGTCMGAHPPFTDMLFEVALMNGGGKGKNATGEKKEVKE